MKSLSLRKPLFLDDLKGANGPAPAWDLIILQFASCTTNDCFWSGPSLGSVCDQLSLISDRVPFSHRASQVTGLEIVEGVMAGRVRARATSLKSLSPSACSRREGS